MEQPSISLLLQGLSLIIVIGGAWILVDKRVTRSETKIETMEIQIAAQSGDFKELRTAIQTLNVNVGKLTEVMNLWRSKIEHRDE